MVSIYALKCLTTQFAYVGCTKGKLGKRMREHRCLLKQGKHSEQLLQNDWNRYGEDHFAIVVLQCLPDDADLASKRHAELSWMEEFARQGRLYNANRTSFAPTPAAILLGIAAAHREPGKRWTPEANEKRRVAQLGKPKRRSARVGWTEQAKRK